MASKNACPLAFVGLLVEANDDWSLSIERGVMVVLNDKIVDRGQVNISYLVFRGDILKKRRGSYIEQKGVVIFLLP